MTTRGGANSGKTSTRWSGSVAMPKTIIAAAATTTRYRNLRLVPTIQRIADGRGLIPRPRSAPSTPSRSGAPTVTTEVPSGGAMDSTAVFPSTEAIRIGSRTYTLGATAA